MLEMRDIISLATIALAAGAIAANFWIHNRNRRIRATTDLYLAYYTKEFTQARFELFVFLTGKAKEASLKWDYEQWFHKSLEAETERLLELGATLSRLLAFYLAMGQLLEAREIDERIAKKLFRYAYIRWDHWRARFYRDGPARMQYLFAPLPGFEPAPEGGPVSDPILERAGE